MKKVLIATFDNGEEMVFHDLLLFLEERRQIEVGDEFSIYTLKYGDFEINPKSRTVKRVGNKFDILRLVASHPKQVLYQKVGFSYKITPKVKLIPGHGVFIISTERKEARWKCMKGRELLTLLNDLAREKHATPAQISLAWMLRKKPFIIPIPGSRKTERLRENFDAASVVLDAAEIAAIARRMGYGKKIVLGDKKAENAEAEKYGEITMLVNAAGVSPSQAPVETISSQSGHRMKQLSPDEDEQLACTPTEEL